MLQEHRHQKIEQYVKQHRAVKVTELATMLRVSIDTVRRDLETLEKTGVLKRVHGGAISKTKTNNVLNKLFEEREVENLAQKQELATLAAELVEEGQAIALNGGTTTIEVAKVLATTFNRLTIITNDIRILSIISANRNFKVILSGGFYNADEYTLYGKQCESVLSSFNIDIAFITVNGLSLKHGLTDFRVEEVDVIKAMMSNSDYNVVVADATKFETSSYITICDTTNVNVVVSDSTLQQPIIENYNNAGVRVLLPH